MKKILALILALSMALSLAACGNGSDDTPVTAPADTEANEPEVTEPEVTTNEVTTTEEATTEATTTEPEPVLPIEPAVVETITDGENTLERLSMEGFTVTGSTPWNNCAEVADFAVDGDISTYFDGVANGWMEIDFGGLVTFDVIGFCPRTSFQARMVDGMFYVSNDGLDWTMIYTVPEKPAYKMNYVYLEQPVECRYIRYDVPSGHSEATGEDYLANIAELGIYRTVDAVGEESLEAPAEGEAETPVDGIQDEAETEPAE